MPDMVEVLGVMRMIRVTYTQYRDMVREDGIYHTLSSALAMVRAWIPDAVFGDEYLPMYFAPEWSRDRIGYLDEYEFLPAWYNDEIVALIILALETT